MFEDEERKQTDNCVIESNFAKFKSFILKKLSNIFYMSEDDPKPVKNKKKIANFLNIFPKKLPKLKTSFVKSKHVMFVDSLGMELELIHTIQFNQNLNENLRPNKQLLDKDTSPKNSIILSKETFNHKIIVPKFTLDQKIIYKKLVNNGISLNSIKIFDQSSVRGIILTLKKKTDNNSAPISYTNKSLEYSFKKNCEKISKSIASRNFFFKLDLVYIIWSIDEWKSWKYQAAIQKSCKTTNSNENIIKTHEFFIQNLDKLLQVGQILQLIICHQINSMVYYDTNDEFCYNFQCAVKF